jgi:hypothetical protein
MASSSAIIQEVSKAQRNTTPLTLETEIDSMDDIQTRHPTSYHCQESTREGNPRSK